MTHLDPAIRAQIEYLGSMVATGRTNEYDAVSMIAEMSQLKPTVCRHLIKNWRDVPAAWLRLQLGAETPGWRPSPVPRSPHQRPPEPQWPYL